MGRFSPTVTPIADTGLADALGAFTQTYMQASNRKRDRELQDRQTDVEMLHSGYRPQTDDEIAQAVANQPQPLVPGGQPHRLPGMQISDPTQRASLAHALSMDESGNELVPRAATPPVKIGNKGYVQTDDARASAEARREQAALAAALGGAQIENYKSESDLRRYQIEHPRPVAPVPGSPDWLALKVQEAKIAGEYGYHPPRNIDPLSAEGIRAQREIAAGKPAPGSQPNESELKGAAMQHRVIPAGQRVNQFDNRKALDEIASRTGYLGNWASTPAGRQLRNAGKIWAMSVLRPESGASISDKELDGYFESYLPRPGDDEDTLAQKRQARREAEEAVTIQSGRALPKGTPSSAIQADSLAAVRGPGDDIKLDSQAQKLWDAAVAKHGKDKVLREFGPRPAQ